MIAWGLKKIPGSEHGGWISQVNEKYDNKGGVDLGMSEKILRRGPLSDRMYKICTLLSTDYVDNIVRPSRGIAPEALLDAASRPCASCLWHSGRWRV